MVNGQSSTYLQQIGEFEGEGELLKTFGLKYLTKLSYRETSELVRVVTNSNLSPTRLKNLTEEKVSAIELEQSLSIENQDISSTIKTIDVDIYDAVCPEVLFMKDGICVKKQKVKRDKILKEKKERSFTDVMSLELPDGQFETIIAAGKINANDLCKAKIKHHYPDENPLPIVVISDGATSIKYDAIRVFGDNVTHILDWYHLDKKVGQCLSMVALNKNNKEQAYEQMINYLWEGKSDNAIHYLEQMQSRNDKKREELVKYLRKNKSYIICYKQRQLIGKTIGSGRIEKANDIMVARRQKNNSMAWSATGSTNLAVITAFFYNQNIFSTN